MFFEKARKDDLPRPGKSDNCSSVLPIKEGEVGFYFDVFNVDSKVFWPAFIDGKKKKFCQTHSTLPKEKFLIWIYPSGEDDPSPLTVGVFL